MSTTTAPPGPAPKPVDSPHRVLVVFAGLLLVMLLASLDSTIVSTALPTIVTDLGGLSHLSWVVSAYLLAQTVVTPLYGKLGDLYGRKVVLQVGLVVFLAGSALCGISQNLTELIAFRALQGLGGGGLMVSALGLGLGLVMQVLVLAVQNAVGYSDLGVATSGATLFRSIGGSLGTAILGAIFATGLSSSLAAHLSGTGLSAGAAKSLGSGSVNPVALKKLPAAAHRAYIDAFTSSLSTVFLVAAAIGIVAFALSWLVKQLPLRDTVSTAGVGEAFAVPRPTDSLSEILRGLGKLLGRERVRRAIDQIAERAGVQLPAAECWLLARAGEHADLDEIRARGIPREHVDQALGVLRHRGLLSAAPSADGSPSTALHSAAGAPSTRPEPADGGRLQLTPAGDEVLGRLLSARREHLTELLAGWSPERHDEIGELLKRLAQDLAAQAPAQTRA